MTQKVSPIGIKYSKPALERPREELLKEIGAGLQRVIDTTDGLDNRRYDLSKLSQEDLLDIKMALSIVNSRFNSARRKTEQE